MESDVGYALLWMGFLDGLLGLGEVEFECFPSLMWECLFVPPQDVTGKNVGVVNCNHADVDELGWGGVGRLNLRPCWNIHLYHGRWWQAAWCGCR